MEYRILSTYCFSLLTGDISVPFFGPYGNNVIEDFGLPLPCSADEFHRRWSGRSMARYPEQRERFLSAMSVGSLMRLYSTGTELLELDYKIDDAMGAVRNVHTRVTFTASGPGEVLARMTNVEKL